MGIGVAVRGVLVSKTPSTAIQDAKYSGKTDWDEIPK